MISRYLTDLACYSPSAALLSVRLSVRLSEYCRPYLKRLGPSPQRFVALQPPRFFHCFSLVQKLLWHFFPRDQELPEATHNYTTTRDPRRNSASLLRYGRAARAANRGSLAVSPRCVLAPSYFDLKTGLGSKILRQSGEVTVYVVRARSAWRPETGVRGAGNDGYPHQSEYLSLVRGEYSPTIYRETGTSNRIDPPRASQSGTRRVNTKSRQLPTLLAKTLLLRSAREVKSLQPRPSTHTQLCPRWGAR
jgi:hypothetical protein